MAGSVVVVGAGNAALCAAVAAAEAGAEVVVLERAPRDEAGGNSAYTAGAMRVAYNGPDDLAPILRAEFPDCDFGSYPREEFIGDIMRLTGGRSDAVLVRILADDSAGTLVWMREHGVRFEPAYGTQAFEVDGRWRFWGGLPIRVSGEGKGLVSSLTSAAERAGVEIVYGARAVALTGDGVRTADERTYDGAVVLASGGFEANASWRAEHLGEGWAHAKVRGTRHNTGDGIRMALEAGAARHGDWAGCHSVAWDREAPDTGDLGVAHEYTRNSYQFGIVVNSRGERFLDEGADFRNYTYAAYGRAILEQPGAAGWQVFDAKAGHLLRREYLRPDATVVEADTPEALAALTGAPALAGTIRAFNAGVMTDVAFDPSVKDGRGTRGVRPPKSNWANAIDTPPLRAWAVTCGITFTFGGLRIDESARVLRDDGSAIPGLFAAGELVGGLWYGNYPGGAGLTAGSVFGRRAGLSASRVPG